MSSLRFIPALFRNIRSPHTVSVACTSNPSYIVLKRPLKQKKRVLVPQVREADTAELLKSNSIVETVNKQLLTHNYGTLFAVVQFGNDQFKITENDVIVVEEGQQFSIGDKIRLGKVLLVGSNEFTIFGRPIVSTESVNVEATVVEKTFSETRLHYTMIGGKNIRILKALRRRLSMLRINKIQLMNQFPMATEARDIWKDQQVDKASANSL